MKKPAFEDALKTLAARKRKELSDHPSPDHLLAYHVGDLDSEEIEQLQDHLAICSDCSQFVLSLGPAGQPSAKGGPHISAGQVAQAWQDFRSRLEMPDATQPDRPGRKEAISMLPWALRPQFAYLIAALLLVAAAWLAFQLANLPRQPDDVAQFYSVSTRGATDPTQTLAASAQNPLLVLTTSQEASSYSSYSADLLDEADQLIRRIADPLRLQESFFIQPGQLDPGTYRVRIFGIQNKDREHIADFEFLVR